MYTTYALATIDTVNDHSGFVVLCIILALIMLMVWASYREDYSGTAPVIMLVYLALIAGPAWISWNTGEIRTFVNKPVACDMVDLWGENHEESRRSGKTTHTVTVHNQFVSYRTPEGVVSFPIAPGVPYPQKAILYKN